MSYRAFVSSTFEDLKEHRRHVIRTLRKAGITVDPMEDWAADSDEPKVFSQERVKNCDLCVLLVGFRRGYVPDGSDSSITQLEYEAAMGLGVDVLVFMLEEEAPWPRKFDELDSDPTVRCWRSRLALRHGVEKFGLNPSSIDMGGALGRWLTKKGQQKSGQALPARVEWPKDKSPYPGLLRFDQEYAPVFFGRDREVDEIIAKMGEPMGRFVIVSGASGSGKSSLVDAGVWCGLIQENRIAGSQDWIWLRIQPGDGDTPFASLAWGLKQAFPKIATRPPDVAKELEEKQDNLQELLIKHLAGVQESVLFIDQLEELFTRGFSASHIEGFLKTIIAAPAIKSSRLRVLATVRNEFLGHLAEIPVTRELLNAGAGYHLGTVSPRDLQDMIEKPAEVTGYRFESDLIQRILGDSHEPGQLPLAAYALNKLFERREGQVFTKKAYEEIGGVAGAISTQAELAIARLDETTRAAFDRVFAELVHVERDRPPTRKRVSRDTFKGDAAAGQLIEALAAADCRILVKDKASVEVAHEKLFTAWGKLSEWINSGGDALRIMEHAEEESHRWHQGGMQPKDLWSAERVAAIVNALKRFGKNPSDTLQRFLRPQAALVEQLDNDALSHEQRALIGIKLAEFGDPRQGVGLRADGLPDIRWSKPVGLGTGDVEDRGKISVDQPFRIAIYPVTNAQFEAFLKAADGYPQEDWWLDLRRMEPESPSWTYPNHPRETVRWYEAVAFCRWLTQKYKNAGLLEPEMSIRLPIESEWQLAATGGDPDREYPWGLDFDLARCNSYEARLNRTTAVGIYPRGASPCDALDMVGNVWEWCLDKYDKPNVTNREGGDTRVLRGGSWYDDRDSCRCAYRFRYYPDNRYDGLGFRVCCGLPIS